MVMQNSRPREPTQASRSRMTSQLHAAMEKAELDRYLADGYGVKSNPFTADVGRREKEPPPQRLISGRRALVAASKDRGGSQGG